MALVEISNFPGTPKLRCRVPNGTLFYDWLAANDATFHRDLLIVRNGVKLGDDDELAFELSELDHIQITPVTRHCSRSKRSTASTSGQTSFTLPTRLCE
ncbi:hypothetical protein V6291_03495 [Enterobacter hormaechei]|uniref:hypothetical protein n=1 Tax=Enterobacter hormaechei TaxID=158836 RepID=UPI003B8446CE